MPFPNPATQFGKGIDPSEAGKKGGSSPYNAWKKRVKCTHKCPFWEKCPYRKLSEEKFDGKCAIKQFPHRLQQRTIRWLMGHDDALIDNLIDYLMKVETNVDSTNDPNLQLKYLRVAKEIVQMIIGNRIKIQADINTLTPQELLQAIDEQIKYYTQNENK